MRMERVMNFKEEQKEKVEKIEVLSLGKIVKIGEPIMKVTLK